MTKNEKACEGPVLPAIWGRWRGLCLALPMLGYLGGCATTGEPRVTLLEATQRQSVVKEQQVEASPDRDSRAQQRSERRPQEAGKSYVVRGRRYEILTSSEGHTEKGLASWYGRRFHGRRTANGERYDMYAMTAAHKSLPLPSYVEVTNLRNGRQVLVKVNDRGPFVGDRVIDLSYAAAKELNMIQAGVAPVEVRSVATNDAVLGKDYFLVADKQSTKGSPDRGAAENTGREATASEVAQAPGPMLAGADGSRSIDTDTGGHGGTPIPAATATEDAPTTEPTRIAASSGSASSRTDEASLDPQHGKLFVQAGTFGNRTTAEQLRRRLVDHLAEQVQIRASRDAVLPRYEVKVGPLVGPSQAEGVSEQLAALGVKESKTVIE